MIRDLSKRQIFRSEAYLGWVRSQPCVGCGIRGRQHAHHCIAGRYGSSKHSDAFTVPLCGPCHAELHADWPQWETQHGPQWRHVARTLERAIADGVFVLDALMAKELSE